MRRCCYFSLVLLIAFACSAHGVNTLTSAAMLYITKAQHSMKQGNILSAREFLNQAKKAAPLDPRVLDVEKEFKQLVTRKVAELKKEAEFHTRNKNMPKALELYRSILSYDPEDTYSSGRLVEIRQNQLVIDQFQRTGISVPVESGRSHDSDLYSAISLLVRARDSFQRGDFDASKKHLEQILTREPNFADAQKLKVEIDQREEMIDLVSNIDADLNRGKVALALDGVGRLINAYPSQASYYVLRARIHLRSHSFRLAQEDLKEARLLGTALGELRPYLVEVAVGTGDYSRAYALALGNADLSPCRPWETLAMWYFRVHLIGWFFFVLAVCLALWAAMFFWRQADVLFGRYSPTHFLNLVVCLYQCRESGPVGQIDSLTRISKQMPHPWWLYLNGLCLMEAGQPDRAQELLLRSAESPALAPRAHLFLGLMRGEREQKLADYDFEQSVILLLGGTPGCWIPEFLHSLEEGILVRLGGRMKEHKFFELAVESFRGVEQTALEEGD